VTFVILRADRFRLYRSVTVYEIPVVVYIYKTSTHSIRSLHPSVRYSGIVIITRARSSDSSVSVYEIVHKFCHVTFALGEVTRMVEQKITERVAFVVDFRLPAQARRLEERERLESFQSGPALDHRVRRTRHCKTNGKTDV